ncbi:hypothetical protein EWM64_g4303 [Hericium alpestre]|uniref:ABM domain-containing protein n=1 Tax=Hericium alpestre TaxID=135208 RepID=A0A4Z0A1W8_9AGAM|nr:hypothetical protein EWM64_g4303 [Hericium alpestre]
MPTTLEIVHWPANEAFAQDNTILKPAGDVLTSFQGVQGVWYGQQVEETRVYIAVGWGTMDVHKAFIAGEGNVDKVLPALQRTLAEGASRQMFHGQFDSEDVVTPKAGHEDVVKSILTKLSVLLNESESPAVGGAFAPIIEKEGSYLLLVGWNSVEDKWAKSLQIMEELLGNANITLSYVKLLQHRSV